MYIGYSVLSLRGRVTVVGSVRLSVCLSVCLLSHISHPENSLTYSTGNGGQNICGVFSETAPLQRSSTPSTESHTYRWPFSYGKYACSL